MRSQVFASVLLHTWINVVFGNDKSTALLSVEQNDGLDDLYLQTQYANAPMTPDYKLVPNICGEIKTTDSFRKLTQEENFRSTVQGPLAEVENPPNYVTEFGSRRYELKTADVADESVAPSALVLDLYTCTDDDDSSRKYLLSHGYERDSLFFLFAFDRNTKVAQLKALVRRKFAANSSKVDTQATEVDKYLPSVKSVMGFDFLRNPLCDLNQVSRIKACLLLLNTPYYRNKYILSPVFANLDPKCKRVTLESENAVDKTEELALPCWVRPVSNPWIKIIFLPDAPNVPLYVAVNYRNFRVNTFTTILQGDEVDIVKFDANLKDLLVKDLFWIFQEMATKLKLAYDYVSSKFQKNAQDENRVESTNDNVSSSTVSVSTSMKDLDA